MSFFKFELEKLAKFIPDEKATLKEDFSDEELSAMDNLGILKGPPYLYLSKLKVFNKIFDFYF